jgi:hypothetical protein
MRVVFSSSQSSSSGPRRRKMPFFDVVCACVCGACIGGPERLERRASKGKKQSRAERLPHNGARVLSGGAVHKRRRNALGKQVKEPKVRNRNLRRVHSSRCSQARRRVFRVAGIPCKGQELAWCLASGNVVSEIQRPALVRWGHGHSTIAITALVLCSCIVVVLLLLRLLLAVHRGVRRMRVVLTLRLSVLLLGALSLRRLVRAGEDRWLRVRRTVASVLRHLRRCKGRWLILRIRRSREPADLAAVPSVGLEGIDLRAGITG